MLRTGLLLCLAMASMAVVAQPFFGLKAGGTFCPTSVELGSLAPAGAPAPEAVSGFGYHGGLFAGMGLTDKLSVRLEVLYSVRNHRFASDFDTTIVFQGLPLTTRVEAENRVERAYLELPLMAEYRLANGLTFSAGPALGVLLSSSSTLDGSLRVNIFGFGIDQPFTNIDNSTDGLRSTQLAAVAGLGYRSTGGLDIGVRYWHGMGYLEEDTDLLRTRQSQVQLALGYAFLRGTR